MTYSPPAAPPRKGLKLGKKRIPWVYVIGGVGAAGVVYIMYRRNSATAVSTTDGTAADATTDPNASDYLDSGYSAAYGDGYGGPAYGPIPPAPYNPPPSITSNSQWVEESAQWLGSNGHSWSQSRIALAKYLAHLPLTDAEAGEVEAAIHQFGEPPQNHYAIVHGKPKQPKGTIPPPTGGKYYFVIPAGPRLFIQDNKRHVVTWATWKKFSPKPKLVPIIPSNPVNHLPYGGNI